MLLAFLFKPLDLFTGAGLRTGELARALSKLGMDLTGLRGRDPDLRTSTSGLELALFLLALNVGLGLCNLGRGGDSWRRFFFGTGEGERVRFLSRCCVEALRPVWINCSNALL